MDVIDVPVRVPGSTPCELSCARRGSSSAPRSWPPRSRHPRRTQDPLQAIKDRWRRRSGQRRLLQDVLGNGNQNGTKKTDKKLENPETVAPPMNRTSPSGTSRRATDASCASSTRTPSCAPTIPS